MENFSEHIPLFNISTTIEKNDMSASESQPMGSGSSRVGQSVSEAKAEGTKQRRHSYIYKPVKKLMPLKIKKQSALHKLIKEMKEIKREVKDTRSCMLNLAKVLKLKLSSAFPEETATNGPTTDQDNGIFENQGILQPYLDKLLSEDNKLDVSYFQKEIENPDSLEPYVNRIRLDRGKDTESELLDFQVLLGAAARQMELVLIEEINWDKLLKWGAVLGKTKDLGFRVRFVETALLRKLWCYHAFKR